MAWTGFKSKGFVSDTAGADYLAEANTDQAQAHRNALANRSKQEERIARETAVSRANEARIEAHREAAASRRASRAKAREKSDRVAMYLDATPQKVEQTIDLDIDQGSSGPTPVMEPIDYWQPTLTEGQGQALTSLGSPTVLEIAGATIGTETQNLIAKIREDKTDAGGYFSRYYDEIVMPTSTYEGRNLDQVTRHELLHRLTNELMDSGALQEIALPEMQSILERFDNFTGEATVADFINFVQMNSPTDESGVVPVTGEYANEWYGAAKRFDPRMRTASGQQDYEDWIAFQRELPSERYGGAVVGGEGTPKYSFDPRDQFDEAQISGWNTETLPWGPATVNSEWVSGQGWVPTSTGTPDPIPLGFKDSLFKPEIDPSDRWTETGLGNWPMGDEHALLAAQAARFDLPGQQDYVSPTGETGSYYGRLARFNRAAALKAHPDSRIRAISEAGIPDIVLDKLTEVLSSGGDEVWGQAGSFEGAVEYLNSLVQQYQSGQLGDNLVSQNPKNYGGG